jgi:hypothetical protein
MFVEIIGGTAIGDDDDVRRSLSRASVRALSAALFTSHRHKFLLRFKQFPRAKLSMPSGASILSRGLREKDREAAQSVGSSSELRSVVGGSAEISRVSAHTAEAWSAEVMDGARRFEVVSSGVLTGQRHCLTVEDYCRFVFISKSRPCSGVLLSSKSSGSTSQDFESAPRAPRALHSHLRVLY